MSIEYSYLITDTANDKADAGRLTDDIARSTIVTALDYIAINNGLGNISIWFKAALSTGDKTTLDGVVAAHAGEPMPDVVTYVPDVATLEKPEKEVQRIAMQPGRTGYYMCDRDIRISTAIVGSGSFQDLKVGVSDNKQSDWGEISLVGVYKVDGNGDYVSCADQMDADTNAVLTVYDFIARDQNNSDPATNPIEYDFKGGALWSDVNLQGDVWEHRMYAMMAPNIPASMGGSVRFFDGYLYPYQGKWQEAINSLALKIDPTVSVEAARIRFWIYYPAGVKQNHVLRFITYRKPETN